jgi:hypothetical protein
MSEAFTTATQVDMSTIETALLTTMVEKNTQHLPKRLPLEQYCPRLGHISLFYTQPVRGI